MRQSFSQSHSLNRSLTQHPSRPMDRLAKPTLDHWRRAGVWSQLKDHEHVEDHLFTARRWDTHSFALLPCLMELACAHARHPYIQDFLYDMKRAMMHAPQAMSHSRYDAGVASYIRGNSPPPRGVGLHDFRSAQRQSDFNGLWCLIIGNVGCESGEQTTYQISI